VRKKIWDYLQLIIGISIPTILFFAGQFFNTFANNKQQGINKKQQKIADERYHQEILSKYFDQMIDLITKEQLVISQKGQESRTIARAKTLSALRELDEIRKASLLRFLEEANLIQQAHPVVILEGANLYKANLKGAVAKTGK